jgi:DNA-binding LacI/PurR family transcriptional regulator
MAIHLKSYRPFFLSLRAYVCLQQGGVVLAKKITEEQRVTAKDVARLAGVSQPTVSRVFSAVDKVTPETREKVLAAVLELGYKPNAIARSLTSQKTDIIGIVTQLSKGFFLPTLEKFTSKLQSVGKQVLLFNVEPEQDLDDVVFRVLQYQVDGLIITAATLSSKMVEVCARQGTKVLLFNRYALGAQVNAVCSDNVEGGRMVANYLLDTGHKRPAFLGAVDTASTSIDRLKGFRDRLQERGVTDLLVENAGEYYYKTGRDAARRLLARPDRPDAIFCAGDVLALGAMDAARYDAGLRVPEDVSVIGFDDTDVASWPTYALTTVRQPFEEMVDTGLKLLLESIENKDAEPQLRLFQGQLVKRSTVKDKH